MAQNEYGLEIRTLWAKELLSKRKTVELRSYPLPERIGSSRVWLLATDGPAGQAALGDTLDPLRDAKRARVVGWARFEKAKERTYGSAAEVESDKGKHLVSSSSDPDSDSSVVYGWKEGVTEVLYGWQVAEVGGAEGQNQKKPLGLSRGERLLRSVYLLESAPQEAE